MKEYPDNNGEYNRYKGKGNLNAVSEQSNRPLLREDDRIQRRPEITDNGQTEIKFSDEGIIRAITRLGVVTDNIGRDVISALRGLEKGSGEENQKPVLPVTWKLLQILYLL